MRRAVPIGRSDPNSNAATPNEASSSPAQMSWPVNTRLGEPDSISSLPNPRPSYGTVPDEATSKRARTYQGTRAGQCRIRTVRAAYSRDGLSARARLSPASRPLTEPSRGRGARRRPGFLGGWAERALRPEGPGFLPV